MALEFRCPKHPTYRGLRKPRTDCVDCRELYTLNEAVRIAHKEMKKMIKREKANPKYAAGFSEDEVV